MASVKHKNVQQRNTSNETGVQQVIAKDWPKVSKEITCKLIESVPKRLRAVIEAKGVHTEYRLQCTTQTIASFLL